MKSFVSYFLVYLFKLFSLLSLASLRRIGRVLGRVAWWFNVDFRRVIEENLRLCFPNKSSAELDDLSKQRAEHLGMLALELAYIWYRSAAQVSATVVEVEGDELVRELLADGHGVILLAPHIGNWEALGFYLADNFPVTNMYQPPDNPVVDKIMYQARSRNGAKLAPTNTSGVKALLRALKNGETVGVLPDQVPIKNSGDFAPFFGIPALTLTLCFNLIQRTGAKVVITYAQRLEQGGFKVVFEAAAEGIYAEDQTCSLTALNSEVEKCARKIPEQYQWEYKRFKRQPGGRKKYYRKK